MLKRCQPLCVADLVYKSSNNNKLCYYNKINTGVMDFLSQSVTNKKLIKEKMGQYLKCSLYI